MRLLHIIAAYKPALAYGGPTMSVATLCEELVSSGLFVTVFTTTANGPGELPVRVNVPVEVDGVPVTYFRRITKDHTHFSPALLKAVWRIKNIDAIHIHTWWNLVSVFACMIALAKGIPVILSPRGTLSDYSFSNKNTSKKKLIHDTLGKRLLARCHILATSEHEAAAVRALVTPVSNDILPNFVKLNDSIGTQPLPYDTLKLLFYSRIEEKKGLDILLGALKMVTIPFHLTIAGNGHIDYIDQLKASIPATLNDRITWAGFYNDDKFNLLSKHHLMILPSHDENFGNVVIESLSVGTAVLISENVGLASYIKTSKLGWICQTTPDSVSAAINNIGACLQPELDNIRSMAPGIVRRDFTGNTLLQRYIRFYQTITK